MSPATGNRQLRKLTLLLSAVVALGLGAAAILIYPPFGGLNPEARTYVISDWPGTAELNGCDSTDRPGWEGLLKAWYQEITDVGSALDGVCLEGHCEDAFEEGGAQVNGYIVNSQFADQDVVGWGKDAGDLEKANAAMVGWHGQRDPQDPTNYLGSMRINESTAAGDEPGGGDCELERDEMKLGNDGLDFLHFSSCHSMGADQWSSWPKVYEGAHQIDGFHGLTFLSYWQAVDYENFAFDAFYMSIADAWIDNMYRPHIEPDWEDPPGQVNQTDQCPVAHAVGRDGPDAWNRLTSERYDNVLEDSGSANYWFVTYMVPCYPDDDIVLDHPLAH